MRKLTLFVAALLTLFSCGKDPEITDTCITSCGPSVPGMINIAIEDHTGLEITNFTAEINGQTVAFPLFSKTEKGNFSCWKSFDDVRSITLIQFDIGDNAIHQENVNYADLAETREYSFDVRSNESTGIQIQLVSSPDCVSSPN